MFLNRKILVEAENICPLPTMVRNYFKKIEVLNKTPAVKRETGRVAKTSSNIIHAPEHGPQQQIIVYRIYLPDTGTAPLGGVDLPEVIVDRTVAAIAPPAAAKVVVTAT